MTSRMRFILHVLILSLMARIPALAQDNVETTSRGLLIKFIRAQVELAATEQGAFRLSVANHTPEPVPTTFLANINFNTSTPWQKINEAGMVGIKSSGGELLMNPQSGEWMMKNAQGEVVIPPHGIGESIDSGKTVEVDLGWNTNTEIKVYGCGNGTDTLQQTKATTKVSNGKSVIPYYWSEAGYAVLAVATDDNRPAFWLAGTSGDYVRWMFPGDTADLYLMPAATLEDAARAYARLTGFAPVPPRWAFGYLQSRWGWKDPAYIEDTLHQFRQLKVPVDAFIFDFEWYTLKPDYELQNDGLTNFTDFYWNPHLFPTPAKQVADYKKQGVQFVGIRKPRLGNTASLAMMHSNHWDMVSAGEKYHLRDVNFKNPGFREWYIAQSADLLRAGVAGWWDDEGEGSFTTYYYWNLAESDGLARFNPHARLWTLNRAFSPGLQRFGAAVWSGDINGTWQVLRDTPTSLLNWSMAGMPYGTCDIGGFFKEPSPELLSRWMEAGVFFPVMRSHSEIKATPRFPWLYGTNALNAIRKAVELRYRLIPFYYSLAHETFSTGVPLMRPLVMEFPGDAKVADRSDEWMMGSSLLAAPVMQEGETRSVYFPAGDWYVFGTNQIIAGNQTIDVTAALDEIPVYVPAGTILPLGPVVQSTADLPGGPLEVQVYPGKDAEFTLVEDDGATKDYMNGAMRKTTFTWDNTARQLRWHQEGAYAGGDIFKKLNVVLFDRSGRIQKQGTLKRNGSVSF